MSANEIVLFESSDSEISLPVEVGNDTVWLTQAQMSELFATTKQNVSLHINNCFKEGELAREAVVKESLTTASDGKMYHVSFYNLDVVISVGYRVKSQRGVEFRQWATGVLRKHIIEGHTENERRLAQLGQVAQVMKRLGGDQGKGRQPVVFHCEEPQLQRWKQAHRSRHVPVFPEQERCSVRGGSEAHSR